jgi:thioredoxin-like negative regulator of GroEL
MFDTPNYIWYHDYGIVLFTWKNCDKYKDILPVFKLLEEQYTNIKFFTIDMDKYPEFTRRFNVHCRPAIVTLRMGNPCKYIYYTDMSHEDIVNKLSNLLHKFNEQYNNLIDINKLHREANATKNYEIYSEDNY